MVLEVSIQQDRIGYGCLDVVDLRVVIIIVKKVQNVRVEVPLHVS